MVFSIFGKDIAIDLGTANTLIFVQDEGVVLSEPSVVAVEAETGSAIAFGEDADAMVGRMPGRILAVHPLKDGVVADLEMTEQLIKHLIKKTLAGRLSFIRGPRAIICIPGVVTELEKRAACIAAKGAGVRSTNVLEEPLAAAIGAGLIIDGPCGNMVVDIGGGTTDTAVISLNGIVVRNSIRVGGKHIDEAIAMYIRTKHNISIGEKTAEELKIALAYAVNPPKSSMDIRGRDLISGLPRSITITAQEVHEAIDGPIKKILQSVKETLEVTPPELAGDIMDRGIMLTGGGALLKNISQLIANQVRIRTAIADNPLRCVVMGAGMTLEDSYRPQSVMSVPTVRMQV